MKQGTTFVIEVNPKIPRKLLRLEELANNLWYGWDKPTRTLFARLHPGLWDAVGHNPKVFLRRVDEKRLVEAAEDQVFLATFNRVLSAYDTYHNEPLRRGSNTNSSRKAIWSPISAPNSAFTKASRSIPAASASWPATTASRRATCACPSSRWACSTARAISPRSSTAKATRSPPTAIRISTTCRSLPRWGDDGKEVHVSVDLPGRQVTVKVWQARIGHVTLYLLDTDLEENTPEDRDIAHQLYGGDSNMRIKQEIVLGVGGVRALQRAGPEAHGVAHQRRPCRLPGAGARPLPGRRGAGFRQRAGSGCRQYRVHHPHAGAGRARPFCRRHGLRLLPAIVPGAENQPRSVSLPGPDAGRARIST